MPKVISESNVYEVVVTTTIKKRYTVRARSEDQAEEKLAESGIVSVMPDSRDEYYEENYEVIVSKYSGVVDLD
jgi:hypothetical protein